MASLPFVSDRVVGQPQNDAGHGDAEFYWPESFTGKCILGVHGQSARQTSLGIASASKSRPFFGHM